jgi:hypothetical protein
MLFRDAIAKFIAAFVQNRFDERIERLRSDLRRTEEAFKREIEAGEKKINTLVETTLSLRTSRQSALQARQLTAVERLWETKTEVDRFKFASDWMSGNYIPDVLLPTSHPQAEMAVFRGFQGYFVHTESGHVAGIGNAGLTE